ncbi:uncharacterized protein LOC106468633 [Limulus polyphemus]|uniref:Uncharacterized protein LOC106468633 n=1 Tax=Limulus polyphemus TaxID=6850 RepID=A0ABM1T9Y1_LIMPO|nr:uncharacterized protein LOC106468633 [Limulus polyphemus]
MTTSDDYVVLPQGLLNKQRQTIVQHSLRIPVDPQKDPNYCESSYDCKQTDDAYCDEITNRCACKSSSDVLSREGWCYPVRQTGEPCTVDEQCEFNVMNSVCETGICACKDNFTLFRDFNVSTCISGRHMDMGGEYDNAEPPPSRGIETKTMIPIVVFLGIMFVGMCVALQLFSRARFRNERTIFNSPHPRLMHIRLGKKRKGSSKRASHASLHVPGSRRPSTYSQRSHPSPRSLRSVTPSDSQEVLRSPVKEHPESPAKPHGSPNGEAGLKSGFECDVNGPTSPTVIITDTSGTRSKSNGKSPSLPTQV